MLGTDAGDYTLTGDDAALFPMEPGQFIDPLAIGHYAIGGTAAALILDRLLMLDTATYIIVGVNPNLTVTFPYEGPPDGYGQRGQSEGRLLPKVREHEAELEFFRDKAYARNLSAAVPPLVIAQRNLTTTRYPNVRPVTVPAVYTGRPK